MEYPVDGHGLVVTVSASTQMDGWRTGVGAWMCHHEYVVIRKTMFFGTESLVFRSYICIPNLNFLKSDLVLVTPKATFLNLIPRPRPSGRYDPDIKIGSPGVQSLFNPIHCGFPIVRLS